MIPEKYTCDGINVNPQLSWSGIPDETKSLVLIMDDPDAPVGTWTHWTMWNISPDTFEIKENSIPKEAVLGGTSFGSIGYGGPCPHKGTHRYFFKLYALNTVIDLKRGAVLNDLKRAMDGRILKHAEIMGLYKRKGE